MSCSKIISKKGSKAQLPSLWRNLHNDEDLLANTSKRISNSIPCKVGTWLRSYLSSPDGYTFSICRRGNRSMGKRKQYYASAYSYHKPHLWYSLYLSVTRLSGTAAYTAGKPDNPFLGPLYRYFRSANGGLYYRLCSAAWLAWRSF